MTSPETPDIRFGAHDTGPVRQHLKILNPAQYREALRGRFDQPTAGERRSAQAARILGRSESGFRAAGRALDGGDPRDRELGLFFARVRREIPAIEKAIGDPAAGR